MPPHSPSPDPGRSFQWDASRLRRGHAAMLAVVGIAAFGLLGLRAIDLPGPRPIGDDDRLRIEVVHPVEPDIVPGSVMDVGELVDGFQGLPPPLPELAEADWSYEVGGAEDPAPPPPRRVAAVFTPPPPQRREPPPVYESRWFGFDAPRPDFRAERAARRARLEAMDRRAQAAREARRREWIDRREEWLRRRDASREAWRDAGRPGDDWRFDSALPPADGAGPGSFTGPR